MTLWLALGLAALNWIAAGWRIKRLEYVTKPAVMLALLAHVWLAGGGPALVSSARFWIALALVFSLAGDVLLMLPRRQFLGGLVAFLLAHLAYIVGLNRGLPPLAPATVLVPILVGLLSWQLHRRIAPGVPAGLRAPVAAYVGVISLMLISALWTLVRPDWPAASAALAAAGAALFYLSDLAIAWDRFVAPLPHRDLVVMVSYHLGQIGLVSGLCC